MLIDIGVNLTNKRFQKDLDSVLARAAQAGVVHQVVTGTHLQPSVKALELARCFPGVLSCTAGVHPHHGDDWDEQVAGRIGELCKQPLVVAVGECGLDYNRNFSRPDAQRRCFEQQLQIAVEVQKPVFLHERDAHGDFLRILEKYRDRITGAVVHCFTGNKEQMRAYLDLDCHLGITGWICDERRGHRMHEDLRHIPDESLMVETDAPFLLPRDMNDPPKNRRNEPAFLPHVVAVLAGIRGQTVEELSRISFENSKRFFSLDI